MSHFLKNLIARHLSGSGSHIVQPRPKSRFETDSVSGASPGQNNSIENNPLHENSHQDYLNKYGSARAKPMGDNPAIDSVTGNITPTSLHHHINSPALVRLGDDVNQPEDMFSQTTARDTDVFFTSDINRQQHNQPTESVQSASQSTAQQLSINDTLNLRVQTIIARLKNEQVQHSDKRVPANQQLNSALLITDSAFNQTAMTRSQVQLVTPEQTLEHPQSVNLKKHSAENQKTDRASDQTGSLQIPNWLSEIQSDLASRLQTIKSQDSAEPVINVTIGRVEIKAIQQGSAKQPTIQNKPSGIMSLEDYLKQRDRVRS